MSACLVHVTPLHLAAERGYVEVCAVLVAAGAEVDAMDYEVCGGCSSWQSPFLLLRPTHAPTRPFFVISTTTPQGGCTPLALTARNGHVAACITLLEARAAVHAEVWRMWWWGGVSSSSSDRGGGRWGRYTSSTLSDPSSNLPLPPSPLSSTMNPPC